MQIEVRKAHFFGLNSWGAETPAFTGSRLRRVGAAGRRDADVCEQQIFIVQTVRRDVLTIIYSSRYDFRMVKQLVFQQGVLTRTKYFN